MDNANRPTSWLQGARTSQMPKWIAQNPKAFRLLYEFAERSRRTEEEIEYEGVLVHLEPRQFITGRHSTSNKVGISVQEYRTLYKRFEKLQLIKTIQPTNKFTIGLYLADAIFYNNTPISQPTDKPTPQPTNHQQPTTINNEYKNNKNDASLGFDKTKRKEKSFKEQDYKTVIEKYQLLKEINLQGNEFLPIKQEIKTMFLSGRTPDQINVVMEDIAKRDYSEWSIKTVRLKLPETLAKLGFSQINIPQNSNDKALIDQILKKGGSAS